MKPRALKFLVCPACKGDLDLLVYRQRDSEVVEGILSCNACGAEYRIVGAIPRFVETDDYASTFGYQWFWFRTVQLDSANGTNESERTLEATTGWRDEDYAGRLVLDAGVGGGRFAEIVAKKGGEVIGIDRSKAVDAAFLNIGRHDKVHLVQADIFALPFRERAFDVVYSIGVLHHTPDPRAAFERVATMVKEGCGLAVFVYSRHGAAHRISDHIRKVTTRLPVMFTWVICALAIPFYYLYRVPGLGKLLQFAWPISLHQNWRWRWLDTFDWYTPKYQWKFLYPEVYRWFREQDFHDIQIFDAPIRMRGVKAGDSWPRRLSIENSQRKSP